MAVRFAHLTDIHLGHRFAEKFGVDSKKNLITVLQDIRLRGITHLAVTGDIAEDEEAPWFFKTIKEYGFQTYITLGNHDNPQAMELHYEHVHAGRYYYKAPSEQACLLFCDSREAYLDEEQLCWLVKEIEASTLPILVFLHHPVLDCDNSFMDRKYALKNRETVRSALQATHKNIHLFCGHYHTTDERSDGNIHQYITPSIFYQIQKYSETLQKDDKPFGYRIINLDKQISSQIITFGV
ncbi:metallophosphoesterase [Sphaerochaeta associata]|nr:metallophosphoesterase [Sphaerochaeta associata]UOM52394.1 metallophosphoesterase [Sphaerochaeta associata]